MQQVRQRRNNSSKAAKSSLSSECPKRVLNATGISGFYDWRIWVTLSITCLILYYEFGSHSNFFHVSADGSTTDDSGFVAPNSPNSDERVNDIYKKISEEETNWDIVNKEVLPLTPKLGEYHRQIVTSNEISQGYFDQAMIITFSFNHDEAIRSLKYAIKLDANCAMCHWGIANNYGLNINRAPDASRLGLAIRHAKLAKEISSMKEYKQDDASQSMIDAMIVRFPQSRSIEDDSHVYLVAYMNEMKKLVAKYDNDVDLMALYAESIMNTMPWDYYTGYHNQEIPKDDTKLVYQLLEKCLKIDQNHLLALHLHIHIYEASLTGVHSQHVEDMADRLRDLMQPNMAIGHLIHMPSHIYIRIGRFEDALEANLAAIDNAESYFEHYNITIDGWNMHYRNLYYCHRETFVTYTAMMSGQFKTAMNMQYKLQDTCQFSCQNFEFFFEDATWLSKILLKFGKFSDALALTVEKDVIDDVAGYGIVQYYFAQAFAFVSMGECEKGWNVYQTQFLPLCKDDDLRSKTVFSQSVGGLFDVADHYFLGRYYDKCSDNVEKSLDEWEQASILNMGLAYMEPPFWPMNPRACQGQVLLDHERFDEAEKIFKQDVTEFVKNGWGLKGLEISLKKQGKEYDTVTKEFNEAWKFSDTPINKACF